MDLIRTGIGLSRTIRNIGRLREILLVFAKHGFDEFITSQAISKIPNFVLPKSQRKITEELVNKSEKDWNQVLGSRLRRCFEELGPAFIKFGQLLSARDDLFHASFIEEMGLLRDKVKPVEFVEVKDLIEQSLKSSIDEIFSSFSEKAIATASIGVVFKAVLRNDGSQVVVKVRRPGIEKEIETDFSILMFLAAQAEKVSRELRFVGISRVVNDFAVTLNRELNFHIEAMNAERLKRNIERHDNRELYYVPKVFKEYSSGEVLVIEELKGIPFSRKESLIDKRAEIIPKLEYGVKLFLKTFLNDGFFHADLHGGNFFYLDDGRIGLVDFGLMGSLSKKGRHHFIAIIYAILTHNHENLVYEFLDVAEYDNIPDTDALTRDVRDALSLFVGLSVKQTNFSEVIGVIFKVLKKHQIYIPREWYVVFRALMTIDGSGRQMGLDLNIISILEEDIDEIIVESFSKKELIDEVGWGARDYTSSLRLIPRHLKWFLRDFAKKGYAFEVKSRGYERELNYLAQGVHFFAYSLLASVFLFSGVYVLKDSDLQSWRSIPTLSWIFWSASLAFFTLGVTIQRPK